MFQQIKFLELVQRDQHEVFAKGCVEFSGETKRDVSGRAFAVTGAPNERGAAIEAMSLVTFEIVDQDFIGQVVDY